MTSTYDQWYDKHGYDTMEAESWETVEPTYTPDEDDNFEDEDEEGFPV